MDPNSFNSMQGRGNFGGKWGIQPVAPPPKETLDPPLISFSGCPNLVKQQMF